METLLSAIGLLVTFGIGVATLLYAKSADRNAKRSVKLQEEAIALQAEDLRRQREAQRPGLRFEELASSHGGRMLQITHLSCAPLPRWQVESARSLAPDRARLVLSDGLQRPVPRPAAAPRLYLGISLPFEHLRPDPIQFFVMFTPGFIAPAEVEITVSRADGETFAEVLSVHPVQGE